MVPFGLKLWENAFQMISDISFFDIEKKLAKTFDENFVEKSANSLFRRSYGFLDGTCRCASKNDPRGFDFQLSTTLGRGVKVVRSIFGYDLIAKSDFYKKVIYETTKL